MAYALVSIVFSLMGGYALRVDDQHFDDYIDAVWVGEDVLPQDPDQFQASCGLESFAASINDTQTRQFIFLGPQDSGTHLVLHSLFLNWPERVGDNCHWNPGPGAMCGIWKHVNNGVHNIYNVLQGETLSDIFVVIAVRSPLSQVSSWLKTPYNMGNCVSGNMTHKCTAELSLRTLYEQGGAVTFDSIVDAYNKYMQQYKQLETDGKFAGVQLVPYEDMVMDPEGVLGNLASFLGLPSLNTYQTVDSPAKDQHSNGRARAMKKLKERSYLSELQEQHKISICNGLDRSAIEGLSEGEGQRPYDYDCREIGGAA